jgi:hypothetical protein
MNQIVLDQTSLSTLNNASGPTEIVDTHGRVHGVYMPARTDDGGFDLAEADRILREEGHLAVSYDEIKRGFAAIDAGRQPT